MGGVIDRQGGIECRGVIDRGDVERCHRIVGHVHLLPHLYIPGSWPGSSNRILIMLTANESSVSERIRLVSEIASHFSDPHSQRPPNYAGRACGSSHPEDRLSPNE